MILTEISYRGQHAATKDGVENSLVRIYLEILRYSAEVMRIQDRKWPKNLLITAMNDIPLEGIKTCIINEESSLERWLSMQQFLESRENTKDILAQGGNILQVVHDIHDKLKVFQSKVAENAVFDTYEEHPAGGMPPWHKDRSSSKSHRLDRQLAWRDSFLAGGNSRDREIDHLAQFCQIDAKKRASSSNLLFQ